jgi:translation initiation factor IF-3
MYIKSTKNQSERSSFGWRQCRTGVYPTAKALKIAEEQELDLW